MRNANIFHTEMSFFTYHIGKALKFYAYYVGKYLGSGTFMHVDKNTYWKNLFGVNYSNVYQSYKYI